MPPSSKVIFQFCILFMKKEKIDCMESTQLLKLHLKLGKKKSDFFILIQSQKNFVHVKKEKQPFAHVPEFWNQYQIPAEYPRSLSGICLTLCSSRCSMPLDADKYNTYPITQRHINIEEYESLIKNSTLLESSSHFGFIPEKC